MDAQSCCSEDPRLASVSRVIAPVHYVAVVDDDESIRVTLARLLHLSHYEAVAFASGEEFLLSLRLRVPVCAILDVRLQGLSGNEVQAQLIAMKVNVPAIFITASDDPDLDRVIVEANGATLLRKPFASAALLEAIDAAVGAAGGRPIH